MKTEEFSSRIIEEPKVISEEDFRKIIKPFADPLFSLSDLLTEKRDESSKLLRNMGFLAAAIKQSSDTEHLLDLYSAKNNRDWIYFRELTATIKNFSKASFQLEELMKNNCPGKIFPDNKDPFWTQSNDMSKLFRGIIEDSFKKLKDENRRLKLKVSKKAPALSQGVKMPSEIILPHNIEEFDASDTTDMAKKFAHRFVEMVEGIAVYRDLASVETGNLETYLPEKIDEQDLRQLGAQLHNLQSQYDTYIFNHLIEKEFPLLKSLRNIISCQMNLAKIGTILSHYYERHLFISSPVMKKLEKIVPPAEILKFLFNFVLFYLVRLSGEGKVFAETFVHALVEIVTYELPVPMDLGFHARPSTKVAKVVQHYGANVKMIVEDQVFDAGSVLWLLSAGGYVMTKGLRTVRFQGDKRALDDLKLLAKGNYGETKDGKDLPLPDALSYLS